jgi:hypothetical protein
MALPSYPDQMSRMTTHEGGRGGRVAGGLDVALHPEIPTPRPRCAPGSSPQRKQPVSLRDDHRPGPDLQIRMRLRSGAFYETKQHTTKITMKSKLVGCITENAKRNSRIGKLC